MQTSKDTHKHTKRSSTGKKSREERKRGRSEEEDRKHMRRPTLPRRSKNEAEKWNEGKSMKQEMEGKRRNKERNNLKDKTKKGQDRKNKGKEEERESRADLEVRTKSDIHKWLDECNCTNHWRMAWRRRWETGWKHQLARRSRSGRSTEKERKNTRIERQSHETGNHTTRNISWRDDE